MKILHITKKYPDAVGGDATVVANLEKQQKKAGHQVLILTSNCDEIKNHSNVYKFGLKDESAALDTIKPRRIFSLVILFFRSYKILKVEKPDIIHTHSIDMAFFVSFAARHLKIPIVHTFHVVTFNDLRQSKLRRNTELLLLKGARPNKIFVLNPADVKNFSTAGFQNIVFIPNGVDIDDWNIKTQRKKNKKFTFVSVGRLEEQKGFAYLIDAAAKLLDSHKEFQVQIIGDGSLRPELQKQIEMYNLTQHVFLLGRRRPRQVKELYATADAFVLSSLWEGMPLTLLEAWAAGLPAIATKVNSIPYIASGLAKLVEPARSDKLESAMEEFIEKPDSIDLLGKKSHSRVAEKYQWSTIAHQVEENYAY